MSVATSATSKLGHPAAGSFRLLRSASGAAPGGDSPHGGRIQLPGALLSALLLVPGALSAQVSSSPNYSVEVETIDGAGGLCTSANYSIDGSLEPLVAGLSTSTNYGILHGFITGMTLATPGEYDTWAQARGLTAGVNAGLFDDPNNDGQPNINHFAFDSDPLGGGSEEGKRQASITVVDGVDYLTLTIPVRTGAVFQGTPLFSNRVDGVFYEVLGDTDLDPPWIIPVVELIPALDHGLPALGDYNGMPGADWQYRTFRLADPLNASVRYFLKAGVTAVP